MHPRLIPGNAQIAASSLQGQLQSDRYVDGRLCSVVVALAPLLRAPGGALDTQLLRGQPFLALHDDPATGLSFGQSVDDDYVGYVPTEALGDNISPTHIVTALASHAYASKDIKSANAAPLVFGTQLAVSDDPGDMAEISDGGWVPRRHISPIGGAGNDHTGHAEIFIGAPYLWGGNSVSGIDCSGLVQVSVQACGHACQRDTDMQTDTLGHPLDQDQTAQRGDFVFWKGHVGIMQNADTLLHANAHFMSVTSEPLEEVVTRITDAGGGPITCRRRLNPPAG